MNRLDPRWPRRHNEERRSMNQNTMDEIRNLQKLFTDAHALLNEGRILDMTGVENRISQVCKAAQTAEPDMQQKYLPELTVLIDLLNTYEQNLRTLQNSLKTNDKPAE